MAGKREDRRVGRTRRLMHEALIALIVEKGYEAVTVQDILDRADVGRSTFYAHFRNKDELLLSGFEQLRRMLEQQQRSLRAARNSGEESDFNFILEFFRHIDQHRPLYRAMVGRQSGEMVLQYLHKYLVNLLKVPFAVLVKGRKSVPVPAEITVHWLVSTLLALATWWLDNKNSYTAERMDEIFRRLTAPGIEAVLGRQVQRAEFTGAARGQEETRASAFYSLFTAPGCC